VSEKERGKRERKRRNKMSNALGEGAISTPAIANSRNNICIINGKKEEKWK
jgi:hypothetical protein